MQPRNVQLVQTRRRADAKNVKQPETEHHDRLTVGTVLARILIAIIFAALFLQFMYMEGQDVAMGVVTG